MEPPIIRSKDITQRGNRRKRVVSSHRKFKKVGGAVSTVSPVQPVTTQVPNVVYSDKPPPMTPMLANAVISKYTYLSYKTPVLPLSQISTILNNAKTLDEIPGLNPFQLPFGIEINFQQNSLPGSQFIAVPTTDPTYSTVVALLTKLNNQIATDPNLIYLPSIAYNAIIAGIQSTNIQQIAQRTVPPTSTVPYFPNTTAYTQHQNFTKYLLPSLNQFAPWAYNLAYYVSFSPKMINYYNAVDSGYNFDMPSTKGLSNTSLLNIAKVYKILGPAASTVDSSIIYLLAYTLNSNERMSVAREELIKSTTLSNAIPAPVRAIFPILMSNFAGWGTYIASVAASKLTGSLPAINNALLPPTEIPTTAIPTTTRPTTTMPTTTRPTTTRPTTAMPTTTRPTTTMPTTTRPTTTRPTTTMPTTTRPTTTRPTTTMPTTTMPTTTRPTTTMVSNPLLAALPNLGKYTAANLSPALGSGGSAQETYIATLTKVLPSQIIYALVSIVRSPSLLTAIMTTAPPIIPTTSPLFSIYNSILMIGSPLSDSRLSLGTYAASNWVMNAIMFTLVVPGATITMPTTTGKTIAVVPPSIPGITTTLLSTNPLAQFYTAFPGIGVNTTANLNPGLGLAVPLSPGEQQLTTNKAAFPSGIVYALATYLRDTSGRISAAASPYLSYVFPTLFATDPKNTIVQAIQGPLSTTLQNIIPGSMGRFIAMATVFAPNAIPAAYTTGMGGGGISTRRRKILKVKNKVKSKKNSAVHKN